MNQVDEMRAAEDIETSISRIMREADTDLLSLDKEEIQRVIRETGFHVHETHFRKMLKVRRDYPDAWAELVSLLFVPSMNSPYPKHRATLKSWMHSFFYALFPVDDKGKRLPSWYESMMTWLDDPVLDTVDHSEIFVHFFRFLNLIDKDYLKLLKASWIRLNADQRMWALSLGVKASNGTPVFYLKNFDGIKTRVQKEKAMAWLNGQIERFRAPDNGEDEVVEEPVVAPEPAVEPEPVAAPAPVVANEPVVETAPVTPDHGEYIELDPDFGLNDGWQDVPSAENVWPTPESDNVWPLPDDSWE